MGIPNSAKAEHVERIVSCITGVEAGPVPLPPEMIKRSWERCLNSYRLDPSRPGKPTILTAPELVGFREPMEKFLRIAGTEMQRLYRQIVESDYVVLLTDANGVAVDYLGTAAFERELKEAGLYLGSMWAEAQEGTNGVGTCIATGQPLTIHRTEHFRTRHTGLTCTVAPVFDPQGRLLAVLDVSSMSAPEDRRSQLLALQLVRRSAQIMEDAYFLVEIRRHWVLRLHCTRETVDVLTDGMIAVDGDGRIVAATQTATRLNLGRDSNSLLGRTLAELFGISLDSLLAEHARKPGAPLPLQPTGGGPLLFATLRLPSEGRIVGTPARPERLAGTRPRRLDLDRLAGGDPVMRANVHRARRVLDKDISILITGETGTGKEAFARAIHDASRRAAKPFIGINCAAIPETLIESELFGYMDGAFTGARRSGMRGKVQQADGGTLFLDEIGDMPAAAQTRLLRVLAEKEVLPLGGDRPVPVDLHVIAATHHDLGALVARGWFRDDLYYRLNNITLTLPPLRDRTDKADLIRSALDLEAAENGIAGRLDPAAFTALMAYEWPGNVRQLRGALRVALAMSEDGIITPDDLPPEIAVMEIRLPCIPRESIAPASAEAEELLTVLRRHCWCVTRSARELGISRATLHRKIRKYGIVQPNHLG